MNKNVNVSLRRPATAPQKNKEMKERKQNIKKRLTSPETNSMNYDKYRVPSPILKHVRLSYDNSNKQNQFI